MLVKICNQVVQAKPLQATAGLHERKVVPVDKEGMRYLRFRAIGCLEWPTAGPNGNHDGFLYQDFEDSEPGYGYRSFINKKAHVEHNSKDSIAGSIGDLPDAFLRNFIYPSDLTVSKWEELAGKDKGSTRLKVLGMPNQQDGSIEVLMRIDTNLVKSAQVNSTTKRLLERIVRMIDTGQQITCSMGSNVAFSNCSSCGNRAQFSNEYCNCLKHRKGALSIVPANQIRDLLDKDVLREEWLKHTIANKFDINEIVNGSSNKSVASRNIELNHKLSFFELSIVGVPAYPDAKMLEKLARKSDETHKEHLRRLTAEFSNEDVLDIYEILQERGLISSQCTIG